MVLLLDENIPRKLKYRFSETHEVLTVPEMGWSGIKNGDLLRKMQQKEMTVLLSVDKNMSHQQNLEKYNVCLLVFGAKDTRYETLLPFVEKTEKLLEGKIAPGLTVIE
ncbi:hypothetical protein U1E44_05880 [Arenibacter sp. GZD96]|uniref:DUF5615 family PIN-like protein n=1 Tax=Aurantibrevibacter litoralis TaxID=3106030 RepID=UPI002AFF4D28|nr:DUF5615 family PIN-like protein [Arenibacter sp. GZD-96]MEA1785610.1 hypothetical protein [Arenibacter sp. GZD-96]